MINNHWLLTCFFFTSLSVFLHCSPTSRTPRRDFLFIALLSRVLLYIILLKATGIPTLLNLTLATNRETSSLSDSVVASKIYITKQIKSPSHVIHMWYVYSPVARGFYISLQPGSQGLSSISCLRRLYLLIIIITYTST